MPIGPQMPQPICGGHRSTLGVRPCFPPCLRQGLSYILQFDYPSSVQTLSCFRLPPSRYKSTGLQALLDLPQWVLGLSPSTSYFYLSHMYLLLTANCCWLVLDLRMPCLLFKDWQAYSPFLMRPVFPPPCSSSASTHGKPPASYSQMPSSILLLK